jgi:hypothetical protein
VVATVCVVAAAVAVPLVLLTSNGSDRGTRPAATRTSFPVVVPKPPHVFWALAGKNVTEVYLPPNAQQSSGSTSDTDRTPIALGVSADAGRAYAGYAQPGCRTTFQVHTINAVSGLKSVAGRVASVAMAVSPDGTKLAFVLGAVRGPGGTCRQTTRLAVLTLATHDLQEWSVPRFDAVRSLQWSPNSRDLAYLTARACAFLSFAASSCYDDATAGTRVIDTAAVHLSLLSSAPLLPAFGSEGGYGPVFWWHDVLATTFNGSLRRLNGHGGLGVALATGFPEVVDAISSDPSGDLLVSSEGKTYRWEAGRLSAVTGAWAQPGW